MEGIKIKIKLFENKNTTMKWNVLTFGKLSMDDVLWSMSPVRRWRKRRPMCWQFLEKIHRIRINYINRCEPLRSNHSVVFRAASTWSPWHAQRIQNKSYGYLKFSWPLYRYHQQPHVHNSDKIYRFTWTDKECRPSWMFCTRKVDSM